MIKPKVLWKKKKSWGCGKCRIHSSCIFESLCCKEALKFKWNADGNQKDLVMGMCR